MLLTSFALFVRILGKNSKVANFHEYFRESFCDFGIVSQTICAKI
jgi:hypothetical protein